MKLDKWQGELDPSIDGKNDRILELCYKGTTIYINKEIIIIAHDQGQKKMEEGLLDKVTKGKLLLRGNMQVM